jgi:hypothetical protein
MARLFFAAIRSIGFPGGAWSAALRLKYFSEKI